MKTYTLGPEGSYSHAAAIKSGAKEIAFCSSISEVFEKVGKEGCLGVVPIENQLNGAVRETQDNLARHTLVLQREVIIPINHCLAAQSEEFDVIQSHPQALAQCREFLRGKKTQDTTSTSLAMKEAKNDKAKAAVGSELAAEIYGLKVIQKGVSDKSNNQTRFVQIGKEKVQGNKTTLIIEPKEDRPGLLADILGVIRQFNLCRIESVPTKDQIGQYVFFIDLLIDEKKAEHIMELLQPYGIRSLGSYGVVK